MSIAELSSNPFGEGMIEKDIEKYAPSYTPEKFTEEEIYYLKPFFSNVDEPIFVISNLPEEVAGALSAKYSRATESMRRIFLKEYVDPIIHPEDQKNWQELTSEEKKESLEIKDDFEKYIDEINKFGGIEKIVNVQRGRKFFDKWLVEFGDDSIAELGGVHLCIEGLSVVATKEIEDQRIGYSPIEKSTRYVSFADKLPDGNFRYIVPGEIKDTPLEEPYRESMDLLFSTYANLIEPYVDYIKDIYPKGEDETDVSFEKSRRAKTFDDIRDLLPFSTITNLGLYGNGRSYEYLINKLMKHPLGEMRYWGYKIASEINKVTPSFIRRVSTSSGIQIQDYKRNIRELHSEISKEMFGEQKDHEKVIGARLVDYTHDGEKSVLAAFVFSGDNAPAYEDVLAAVNKLSDADRKRYFDKILAIRNMGNSSPKREEVRFRKIPRSFENSNYTFELWARGGDYRDLHRHRMLIQERQGFTTKWGYDLEDEVVNSKFFDNVKLALESVKPIYENIYKTNPAVAQYLVPFAYVQHWYMNLTAREMYYIAELRTGPQGRPHYRKITQEMAKQVIEVHPNLFAGMMTDWNDYSLARRESEKRIERKKKEFGA